MKISIGMNIQDGPWGGGNQFGRSLYSFLQNKGIEVFFDLKEKNLDLILLVEPRFTTKISAFNHIDIFRYISYINYKAIIVHRINECDERKGTKNVNKIIIKANTIADATVFVSSWLRDLYSKIGLNPRNSKIILNGGNKKIFNDAGYQPWNHRNKLRLVTHHWSAHHLKGFDVYELLDLLLSNPNYANKFEFTYIGNLPKSQNFSNAIHFPPKYETDLAEYIRMNHVYLTASQNEPGANHPIEGALCGLPILYRPSGSLREYCQGYGIEFTSDNFEEKLNEMYDTYDNFVDRMKDYPFTADRMCQQYYDLFIELLDCRKEIIAQRNIQNRLSLYLESLLPNKLLSKIRGKLGQWMP